MEQAVVAAAFRKLITEAEVPGFAALEATQIGISEARPKSAEPRIEPPRIAGPSKAAMRRHKRSEP